MIVVVTGRIGSGKSFVGELFKSKGADVIEADEIGHEVLGDVKEELVKAFGQVILEDGEVSRKKLADVAFKSEANLRILNGVSHPLLIQKIKKRVKVGKVNVVIAALYYELQLDKIADITILVKGERNNTFSSRQKYIKEVKKFDYVVDNSGSRENTIKQVEDTWRELK